MNMLNNTVCSCGGKSQTTQEFSCFSAQYISSAAVLIGKCPIYDNTAWKSVGLIRLYLFQVELGFELFLQKVIFEHDGVWQCVFSHDVIF